MTSSLPRPTTLAEVARRAGVSPMTVSRVMNGTPTVSRRTLDRVREAINALDYRPNPAARRLAGGADPRIGILYANPSRAYLSELLLGAIDAAGRHGLRLELVACDDEAPAILEPMLRNGVSGVILPPPLSEAPGILATLMRAGVDAVAIAGTVEDRDAIGIDDAAAAGDITRLLIDAGHRRIGFIAGDPNQRASGARLAGYRCALADRGLATDEALVVEGRFTFESGLAAAQRLLGLAKRPSAIVASNDDMGAATILAALRAGLRVPQDLSVTGFDDTLIATSVWPQLTTVRQPIAAMAGHAVERLTERARARALGEPLTPLALILPHSLVIRGSTGAI